MLNKIAFVSLATPAALFTLFLAVPSLDHSWGTFTFHFYVVSAASLMAACACLVLVISARSMRETRILFLALSFFALGMFFAIHGLTTPGFLFDQPYAALERSPWLSTLAAGLFATLSVISIPKVSGRVNLFVPEVVFAVSITAITLYFGMSMIAPNWLEGFPTTREWFQHLLTAVTVSLLCFAGFRYYQSYQFARLPAQMAVAVGLFFLAEAQISLDFGVFWQYSWWMYHALFLAAFGTVLLGWSWELIRAKDTRALAEGIAMRDALSQLPVEHLGPGERDTGQGQRGAGPGEDREVGRVEVMGLGRGGDEVDIAGSGGHGAPHTRDGRRYGAGVGTEDQREWQKAGRAEHEQA